MKCISLEAEEQGIPSTKIFCTQKSNTNPHYCKPRFDWVTVIDSVSEKKVVCQVAALWELRVTSASNISPRSFLYFSCIPTVSKPCSRSIAFTKICYNLYGRDSLLKLITDKVDVIVSPEIVLPESMNAADYILSGKQAREKVTFYHVPFYFLFRDDWGYGSVNLSRSFVETTRRSPSALAYVNGSTVKKREMFETLIDCIKSNEDIADLPDAAILAGTNLQIR